MSADWSNGIRGLATTVVLLLSTLSVPAADFDGFLKPLFAKHCVKCHGGEKVKGKVNLKELATAADLLGKPELIEEMLDVIDAGDMPPEDEPQLSDDDRTRLLTALGEMLRESTAGAEVVRVPMRRLNRFQYNNAVRDLFQLDRDVFALSEKLMTRRSGYLDPVAENMPATVEAACLSLETGGGMAEVVAFPKDLRAAHGFDNQANQLTLSPLLLDAFIKLSVSIVESPDFKAETVGLWNGFFAEPEAGADIKAEIRKRLTPFLWLAFRTPVDRATINRYADHAHQKIEGGLPFPAAMKKVASAVLASPRFLYRYEPAIDEEDLFGLASRLSFFLWASGPDWELLRLAKSGELARPEVLRATVDRMMTDPKIERFLDSFPSQWMQLENVLAATPDPEKARYFNLDQGRPASLQMVLEPLLLFDAVYLENRPIAELIAPGFAYRSEFLETWYTSDLVPPVFDADKVAEVNRERDARRRSLQASIDEARGELGRLVDPVKGRLLQAKREGDAEPTDLMPYAAWEFDDDLQESIGGLHLKAHGNIRHEDGMVVLAGGAFLQSSPLPIDLKAKSLEIWFKPHNLDQRGGGAMGIQGPGDFFDTIVIGERQPRHWISGSNGFARTEDFPGSYPEEKPNELLHLVMVYQEDGSTTLYRNGQPYGKPYRKGAATFPRGGSSVIFGLRHLPPGGNKHLSLSIDRARLYTRALNAEEVAASSSGSGYVTEKELVEALTPEQRQARDSLTATLQRAEAALRDVPPNQDPDQMRNDAHRAYENEIRHKLRAQSFKRVPATDPRYGGVVTNAAMLSMTSGPKRTHPIARGAWLIEVIFNDPPPPPPNDVPPLNEDAGDANLTIREKFAVHREHPDCAGCHSRLDPLGFALENYDIIGRWRDRYDNGREVDASGTLLRKHEFDGAVAFKRHLVQEDERFARAFTAHLMRFALARELGPADSLTVDAIVDKAAESDYRLRALMREVILSEAFLARKE